MPKIHIKQFKVGEDAIDIHRHVNNQEYLRWMQEVSIEHTGLQGWPMARYLEFGSSWYIKSHFIEYLRPALLNDEMIIITWISAMMERYSPRQTLFLRARDRQILARAQTQLIFVSLYNGRPIAIPDEVRTAFDIVESEADALALLDAALTPPNP